jgi:hypothetical protein
VSGIEEAHTGISLMGEHVDGSDADGRARALLHSSVRPVRYRAGVSPPTPGDAAVLRIDKIEAV